MKIHSTERTIKFYASAGWSRLLVSQMASDDAIIEERDDFFGTFYRVYEGELIPERLMPMVSKINHFKRHARIPRGSYLKYVEARVAGTAGNQGLCSDESSNNETMAK